MEYVEIITAYKDDLQPSSTDKKEVSKLEDKWAKR